MGARGWKPEEGKRGQREERGEERKGRHRKRKETNGRKSGRNNSRVRKIGDRKIPLK